MTFWLLMGVLITAWAVLVLMLLYVIGYAVERAVCVLWRWLRG
nr:hypothetical protein [Streptomyces polyasparticus]